MQLLFAVAWITLMPSPGKTSKRAFLMNESLKKTSTPVKETVVKCLRSLFAMRARSLMRGTKSHWTFIFPGFVAWCLPLWFQSLVAHMKRVPHLSKTHVNQSVRWRTKGHKWRATTCVYISKASASDMQRASTCLAARDVWCVCADGREVANRGRRGCLQTSVQTSSRRRASLSSGGLEQCVLSQTKT